MSLDSKAFVILQELEDLGAFEKLICSDPDRDTRPWAEDSLLGLCVKAQQLADSEQDEDDEAELNRSYQLGISVGLEQAAGLVMSSATAEFKLRRDAEAKGLRNLSTELKRLSKEAHPGAAK